jgi:hypothetical protein
MAAIILIRSGLKLLGRLPFPVLINRESQTNTSAEEAKEGAFCTAILGLRLFKLSRRKIYDNPGRRHIPFFLKFSNTHHAISK